MQRWGMIVLGSIGELVVSVVLVTAVCFIMMAVGLGDPLGALYGDRLTAVSAEEAQTLRQIYGLDKPLLGQYITWLANLAQGDLGVSYHEGRPVFDMLIERLGATLVLIVPAFAVGCGLAVSIGTRIAEQAGSVCDQLAQACLFTLWSVPTFLSGLILLAVFGVHFELLPIGGIAPIGETFDLAYSLPYLVLPLTVLTVHTAARLTGIVRSAVADELAADYTRSARAVGLPARMIRRYALRNSMFTLITAAAFQLPKLFAGAVVTEMIFAWPGIGRMLLTAAYQHDYPLLLGAVVCICMLTVISSLLADLVNRLLDPRIRRRRGGEYS